MRVRSPSRHHPPRIICTHLPAAQGGMFALMGIGFVLAAPFFSAIGCMVGLVSATFDDFIARRSGGSEVEVE